MLPASCPRCGVALRYVQHPAKPPGVLLGSACDCEIVVEASSTNGEIGPDDLWPTPQTEHFERFARAALRMPAVDSVDHLLDEDTPCSS